MSTIAPDDEQPLHDKLSTLRPYGVAVAIVAVVTLGLLPFRPNLNLLNVALLYLIGTTAAALVTGALPSVVAAVLAFLAFDLLFVPPYYTLTVAAPDHVLALFVFLGIALITAGLTSRLRDRTQEAIRRGRLATTLYELSTVLIGTARLDDILRAVVERVRQVLAVDSCAILFEENGVLRPRAAAGEALDFEDRNLLALAHTVMVERNRAGLGNERGRIRPPGPPGAPQPWSRTGVNRHFHIVLLPIATADRPFGILLVARRRGAPRLSAEDIQVLETFANQAAVAIERSLLAEAREQAAILARADDLKSALLSAVSHDLRTPLASIKASATSLLQPDIAWSDEDRRDLLQAIDEEADRMNELVTNLLDLSRIEAGELRLDLDWNSLPEAVGEALERAEPRLRDHPVTCRIPDDVPPLRFDFIKIVQVIVNLLENAAKYSPPGAPIAVTIQPEAGKVAVAVRDEGSGIPLGQEERIFDKFYRVEAPNRPLGAGVGLAICKGFVEAHGGRIWARSNDDRGATVAFWLPVPDRPAEPAPLEPAAGARA